MPLWKNTFFTARFFKVFIALVALAIFSYWLPALFFWLPLLSVLFAATVVIDIFMLYGGKARGVEAERICGRKFSNGDANPVDLYVRNQYPFAVRLSLLEELPFQFQKRDMAFRLSANAGSEKHLSYEVRPLRRGVYVFGALNVFATAPLGLLSRRFQCAQQQEVGVYPSFIQMRHYELLAISNRLQMAGLKKIRRAGSSKEFEQIDPYVRGDDFRRINWKATARRNALMVNRYQDEKSQKIYCLINKGRAMEMPFNGMSLLDYAINATLVLSNIALQRSDKAGVVTFQHEVENLLPASSQSAQMRTIMELLYREETDFKEADMQRLYAFSERRLGSRSLLLLFTNYESIISLRRQLPYLKLLNRRHLLVPIFFRNTEIEKLSQHPAEDMRTIYEKGLAEELMFQKDLMVQELQRAGIAALLTTPENLTADTLNKYLEIKARGSL